MYFPSKFLFKIFIFRLKIGGFVRNKLNEEVLWAYPLLYFFSEE